MAKTKATSKKRNVKVDALGQLHVHSSFNNIIVSLANSEGQVISWSSAGKMGFRGSKKNTPYAAQTAAEDCAKVAFDLGLRKVKAYVKGPGNGRESAIRRRKMSEYGVMLAEKQKAKYTYGVLERQFRNMFEKSAKAEGITGEVLLQNLESRLDNVVFRLGIAPTRAAARQLVGHKHIVVDGKVVNIPSFSVKPGMVVGVREKAKSLEVIENALAGFNHSKYPWLEWDENTKSGKFLHKPERADIPENIKEQLIVELYSK